MRAYVRTPVGIVPLFFALSTPVLTSLKGVPVVAVFIYFECIWCMNTLIVIIKKIALLIYICTEMYTHAKAHLGDWG